MIYNSYAGGLRLFTARRLNRVLETLRAAGHRVTPLRTPAPGGATELARQSLAAGADLILTLGGDGTLNEAANAMIGTRTPLAVLPAGTANVLARELGIPCRSVAAAAQLAELRPLRIAAGALYSAGQSSPRYFLLMAGAGFDGHIVYHLNLDLKLKLGQLAYWVSAAKEIVRRLDEFETQVAGRRFCCTFALASRVRNYAGWMKIASGASLLSQDFQVAIFEGRSTLRYYTLYLGAVLTGLTGRIPGLTFLRACSLELTSDGRAPVYLQVDGEYAGRLPARVEIVPDALTILAPPAFAAG